MSEYLECPACHKIELKRTATNKLHNEALYEYQCRCGHYATFTEMPKTDTMAVAREKYPGVNAALDDIGYDVLDSMSLFEVFAIAFTRGRTFEAKDTIKKLKEITPQAE